VYHEARTVSVDEVLRIHQEQDKMVEEVDAEKEHSVKNSCLSVTSSTSATTSRTRVSQPCSFLLFR
jgi:hypothetical protein